MRNLPPLAVRFAALQSIGASRFSTIASIATAAPPAPAVPVTPPAAALPPMPASPPEPAAPLPARPTRPGGRSVLVVPLVQLAPAAPVPWVPAVPGDPPVPPPPGRFQAIRRCLHRRCYPPNLLCRRRWCCPRKHLFHRCRRYPHRRNWSFRSLPSTAPTTRNTWKLSASFMGCAPGWCGATKAAHRARAAAIPALLGRALGSMRRSRKPPCRSDCRPAVWLCRRRRLPG